MTLGPDDISAMLYENADDGVFRIHRSMFTNVELFELEVRHIFEENWIFVAHESQLPHPNDFITTHMGRQPVILTRTAAGELKAYLNSCSHRGAQLQTARCGNTKRHTCPFHAWTFSSEGKLLAYGNTPTSGYGPGFEKMDLDLKPVARVESYRGFIFASLSANVPDLKTHLDEAKTFIDMIVDQDPNGEIEVVPGPQAYTYDGNWKLQTENGVDGYHINSIHGNYVSTTMNRFALSGEDARVKPMDVSKFSKFPGGYYAFRNGHVVLWNQSPNPEVRATWNHQDDLVERCGDAKAWWMVNCWRNLCLYPNVFLMDQMSSQIRVIRPISVDRTEIRTLCFAPKSDTPEERENRIRQYEDFFNAAGMATPDDLAAFNASQRGFSARNVEWSDVSRGARNLLLGSDERAQALNISVEYTGTQLEDEGIYLNQHKYWRDKMVSALNRNQNTKGKVEADGI